MNIVTLIPIKEHDASSALDLHIHSRENRRYTTPSWKALCQCSFSMYSSFFRAFVWAK